VRALMDRAPPNLRYSHYLSSFNGIRTWQCLTISSFIATPAPWPGTPISGDPHTVTVNGYESEDGKRLIGIWESSARV
jgi:uncharacterized cupin superfamily protein